MTETQVRLNEFVLELEDVLRRASEAGVSLEALAYKWGASAAAASNEMPETEDEQADKAVTYEAMKYLGRALFTMLLNSPVILDPLAYLMMTGGKSEAEIEEMLERCRRATD